MFTGNGSSQRRETVCPPRIDEDVDQNPMRRHNPATHDEFHGWMRQSAGERCISDVHRSQMHPSSKVNSPPYNPRQMSAMTHQTTVPNLPQYHQNPVHSTLFQSHHRPSGVPVYNQMMSHNIPHAHLYYNNSNSATPGPSNPPFYLPSNGTIHSIDPRPPRPRHSDKSTSHHDFHHQEAHTIAHSGSFSLNDTEHPSQVGSNESELFQCTVDSTSSRISFKNNLYPVGPLSIGLNNEEQIRQPTSTPGTVELVTLPEGRPPADSQPLRPPGLTLRHESSNHQSSPSLNIRMHSGNDFHALLDDHEIWWESLLEILDVSSTSQKAKLSLPQTVRNRGIQRSGRVNMKRNAIATQERIVNNTIDAAFCRNNHDPNIEPSHLSTSDCTVRLPPSHSSSCVEVAHIRFNQTNRDRVRQPILRAELRVATSGPPTQSPEISQPNSPATPTTSSPSHSIFSHNPSPSSATTVSSVSRNSVPLSRENLPVSPTPSYHKANHLSTSASRFETARRNERHGLSRLDTVPPPEDPDMHLTVTISDHAKVKLGPGFEIRDIVTGFETRWIHLGNVPFDISQDVLGNILAPFGKVEFMKFPERRFSKPMTVKIQFSSPSEAQAASTKLNGSSFYNHTLTAKLPINNTTKGNGILRDTSVRVEWEAPCVSGYIGYATEKEAKAAMKLVVVKPIRNAIVTSCIYEGLPSVGAYNVRLDGLHPDTTIDDLGRIGKPESVMLHKPNYRSWDGAIKGIKMLLEECGTLLSFDVPSPPFQEKMVRAWAHFASTHEAQIAHHQLNGRRPTCIGRTGLFVRHVQSMTYTLPSHVYAKLEGDIARLRWSQRHLHRCAVSVLRNSPDVFAPLTIKLSGEDIKALSRLKSGFERLLRGEIVMKDGKTMWDGFLARPAGVVFLQELEKKNSGIEIQANKFRRIVQLFGPIAKRQAIHQEIVAKLESIWAQQTWQIPLEGKLLGLFMSSELLKMQQDLGPENVFLRFSDRTLNIRGTRDTYHKACQVIEDVLRRRAGDSSPAAATCPVCLSEASIPVSLECGHTWCKGCLSGYLAASTNNKVFPLTCLGSEASCPQKIPLTVARNILPAEDFDAIVHASFWSHIYARPDEFHHCPTPDCSQVYRSAPRDTILQCPSCLIRICPACRVEYHDGMTCEERDVENNQLFDEWSSNHDVKNCPSCKIPIERSEGCNHMTCTQCQTHICWVCLCTFPRGEGIYDHMRNEHGGIGL